MSAKGTELRSGYTTGTYSAAAAAAAWMASQGQTVPNPLPVLFPDGQYRDIPILSVGAADNQGYCSVIKDAGDDPDVTNGAEISATVRASHSTSDDSRDIELQIDDSRVFLAVSAGIGEVTRPGLDISPGKWAINPVPQRMISDNLSIHGIGKMKQNWLVTLAVKGGETMATKTLNPSLGVIGGISILGTTGIVVPYSNAAYIDTIRVLVRGAQAAGCDHLVLCTGSRTLNAAKAMVPDLPECAYLRIGDFIAETLEAAGANGIAALTVACMPGKLFKYACGHRNTHAHTTKLDTSDLGPYLTKCGISDTDVALIVNCASIREALELLDEQSRKAVLKLLADQALSNLNSWSSCECSLLVFNNDGDCVLTKRSGEQ